MRATSVEHSLEAVTPSSSFLKEKLKQGYSFKNTYENISWRLNDGLHCKSEVHDGTYSLLSQTGESQNTIKMLMLSVFEG